MSSPPSPVLSAGGSITDYNYVDEAALDRILRDNDDSSTKTPDYASSGRPSLEERERQRVEAKDKKRYERTGKLKTVGNPTAPAVRERSHGAGRLDTWEKDRREQAAQMPTVDFGPTYAYKPSSRPGTSGTITPGDMEKRHRPKSRDELRPQSGNGLRSESRDRLRQSSGSRLSGYFDTAMQLSPAEGQQSQRNSYFATAAQPPTPTRYGTPDIDVRPQRHSMAWTPGAVRSSGNRLEMTADEWVRHKAELAQQPQYALPRHKSLVPPIAHGRHASTNDVSPLSKVTRKTPPPFQRAASGDWTIQAGQQRTPPGRPQSRVTGLSNNQQGGASNFAVGSLTAKEKMYIARATGTPLVDMATASSAGKMPIYDRKNEGLVGSIAARERERASLARGYRGTQLQFEIDTRHQQQVQRQRADAQIQAQIGMQQMAHEQAQQQAQQAMQYQHMMYQQAQQQAILHQQIANQQAAMAQQRHQQFIHYQQPVNQQATNPLSWGSQRMTQGNFHAQQVYGTQEPHPMRGYGEQYSQQYQGQGNGHEQVSMGSQHFMSYR